MSGYGGVFQRQAAQPKQMANKAKGLVRHILAIKGNGVERVWVQVGKCGQVAGDVAFHLELGVLACRNLDGPARISQQVPVVLQVECPSTHEHASHRSIRREGQGAHRRGRGRLDKGHHFRRFRADGGKGQGLLQLGVFFIGGGGVQIEPVQVLQGGERLKVLVGHVDAWQPDGLEILGVEHGKGA